MLAILNNPSYQKRALPLSVAAWHQMIENNLAPDRAELIRGVIIEKMSKSIAHTKLVTRVLDILIESCRHYLWIRSEQPLTLADSEPEPDISVVPGSQRNDPSHPTTAKLVIEVAVTSLADDRDLADVYAEASVQEYWIINVEKKCVEVFLSPQGESYATEKNIDFSGSIHVKGKEIRISEIFPPENQ